LRAAAAYRERLTGERMKSDSEIKMDVEEELRWDPDIDATDVAVAVKNGVVTLSGFVRSYMQKWQAERDAKRVAGVLGVANDLEVRIPLIHQKPDPEIAREVIQELKNELPYTHQFIKVVVNNGWVSLEGDVEWYYQKERAEAAARRVRGVKGISNYIDIKPKVEPTDVKRKIEEAFRRSAEIDANRLQVEANGSEVVLKGTVRSWAEREEAERAAWLAPGVRRVENRIVVSP
jgi:osmotically-inducible protein OsmY